MQSGCEQAAAPLVGPGVICWKDSYTHSESVVSAWELEGLLLPVLSTATPESVGGKVAGRGANSECETDLSPCSGWLPVHQSCLQFLCEWEGNC